MLTAAHRILEYAESLSAGAPILVKDLLHLGNRSSIDQALTRLVRGGTLLRARRGIYVLQPEGGGSRDLWSAATVAAVVGRPGETITTHGGVAANALGLTDDPQPTGIFLTSGLSRRVKLGASWLELRHAPSWQLMLPDQMAGELIRAFDWLGSKKAGLALRALGPKMPTAEIQALVPLIPFLPEWIAEEINDLAENPADTTSQKLDDATLSLNGTIESPPIP